jgi:hypothetical protein
MKLFYKLFGVVILFGLAIMLIALPQHAAPRIASNTISNAAASQSSTAEPVPAYHEQAPKGPLPATMSPDEFSGNAAAQNAYSIAAKIKKTLYQEPCYCHCDRSQGHGSLLDCFVSKHGSGCNICMYEDFYTNEQLHAGKTAAQIREGIIRGDWQSIDAKKYQKPLPTK